MKLLISLTFLASVLAVPMPRLSLHQERSTDGSPSVSINFQDGHEDKLILSSFKMSNNDVTESCSYIGHLEKETTACVAMTGCADEDKELTIFSKHLDQVSMLWSKDGTVNWIDSNLRSGDLWILPRNDDNNSTFELDEDEYVNQEEWQEQLEIEKNCADGSCDDEIQRVHHLEYNLFFDDGILNRYGSGLKKRKAKKAARKAIKDIFTHVQAYFCHESLGSQIKLSLANNMVHVEGTNWHIKSKYDNSFGEVRNWHNHYGLGNADMNLFLGEYQRGMSGVAYLGTACRSTCCNNALVMNKKDKTTTAVTLAHEIGHLIGMNHDHADAHKKAGCNEAENKGFMAYGKHQLQWSSCSRSDFEAFYLKNKDIWCFESQVIACPNTKK